GAVALERHLVGGWHRLVRALPLLAAAPTNSRPCRRQPWPRGYLLRPCSEQLPLAAWPRALPMPAGAAPASVSHARGWPCLLAAAPARGFWPWPAAPLQGAWAAAGCPLQPAWPWVADPAWGLAVVGRSSSSQFLLRMHPDREDKGGQASSSLAVSARWISVAKLLQSDLATLAQREGGE
ncbi:hypothetical protein BHE74_00058267, partial [Ensete ventricosum]